MSIKNIKDDKAHALNTNQLSENLARTDDAAQVDADDPHKVEKLTKAGRDLDPDEGTE